MASFKEAASHCSLSPCSCRESVMISRGFMATALEHDSSPLPSHPRLLYWHVDATSHPWGGSMERRVAVEAEAGLSGCQELHRDHTAWPSKTIRSNMYMESRLGGPHEMAPIPVFGSNGPYWVTMNIGRNNAFKYILGSVLAISQVGIQISGTLQCTERVYSSLPSRFSVMMETLHMYAVQFSCH